MTTPLDLYEVQLFNSSGELQRILQRWNRLAYNQRLSSSWNHQITFELGIDDPYLTTLRSVEDDWFINVLRTDPITATRELVYEGFQTTIVDQLRTDGSVIINYYGVGYADLLKRRVVLPDAGEGHSEKSGPAETIIKAYVNDCMVSPVDTDRKFPGVVIEGSAGLGDVVDYRARYTRLSTVCETLSEKGNVDYGMLGGQDIGTFIFRIKDLWGTDRTIGNVDGNSVVIFDVLTGNMAIPIYSQNSSEEQNYAYVGGAGVEENRVIQAVYDPTVISRSPWARKEFFAEGRQQTDTEALVAIGLEELNKRKKKVSLSFNVVQTPATRWLRDWQLGDLVSTRYFDYVTNKQIAEVKVVVSSGSQLIEAIDVEMHDV